MSLIKYINRARKRIQRPVIAPIIDFLKSDLFLILGTILLCIIAYLIFDIYGLIVLYVVAGIGTIWSAIDFLNCFEDTRIFKDNAQKFCGGAAERSQNMNDAIDSYGTELYKLQLLEARIREEKTKAVNTICYYYNRGKKPMEIYEMLGASTSMSRSIFKEKSITYVEQAIKINYAEIKHRMKNAEKQG